MDSIAADPILELFIPTKIVGIIIIRCDSSLTNDKKFCRIAQKAGRLGNMDKKDSIDAAGGRLEDERAAFEKVYAAMETFLQMYMPEGCLTPAAAATVLGCTKQNLDSLVASGKLHPIRPESCGRTFYRRNEIVELLFQKREDEKHLHFYCDARGDVRTEVGDLIATKEELDKRLREPVRWMEQQVDANPDVTAGELLDKADAEAGEKAEREFMERRKQALRNFSIQGKKVPTKIKKLFGKKEENWCAYALSDYLHKQLRPESIPYSFSVFYKSLKKG